MAVCQCECVTAVASGGAKQCVTYSCRQFYSVTVCCCNATHVFVCICTFGQLHVMQSDSHNLMLWFGMGFLEWDCTHAGGCEWLVCATVLTALVVTGHTV